MAGPTVRPPLGILGGTFDPVHLGHLRTAVELAEILGLGEVRLMPAGSPPHRPTPVAPADLRWRMLVAAVAGKSGLVPDNRELRRAGPSYTVDTLMELRDENGDRPLCLILGADAFAGLGSWHRWRELPDLAHIVVVHRPGHEVPAAGAAGELLTARRAASPVDLAAAPAGRVLLQAVTPLAIAASAIRALVARGGDPAFLVPDAVRDLILGSGCYGPASGAVASPADPSAATSEEVNTRA
ncbi:MAG: nicotinate-nucleotide adenylyltransferase [Chromatiales bacterium]|jgi:nicotinate-nucleotide adenylyltransferase|nr:nicotinate-nucleotide adenylyltransferase [Chromatiales bacterium]